jgi:small subunit ribosomal protein S20
MAHSISAKKRVRQNQTRRMRNFRRKRQYRAALREYREAVLHAPVDEARQKLATVQKTLDRAAAKGAIHKNKADRVKSRMTARLNRKEAGGRG